MTIKQRIEQRGLPLDHVIVVGSGLLDQLGLRPSVDLDLVVSSELFEQLKQSGAYDVGFSEPDEYCRASGIELFKTWFGESFTALKDNTIELEGLYFLNAAKTISWKQQIGREKDARDIKLLKEYYGKI